MHFVTAGTAEAFRHEALFYDGEDGFVAGAVPFIRDGLSAGEPILVAVGPDSIALLRDALGDDQDGVEFADMREIGRNPGRIILAWREFLASHRGNGGVRGIGEPIWAGRTPAELVECQLHESLLNLAFADVEGFRLLCPYDAALDDSVLHEARCSHPTIHDGAAGRASPEYRGPEQLLAPFDLPLPRPEVAAEIVAFERTGLADVRQAVGQAARTAGLAGERADDLVLAASEIAANSLRHGGGRGVLRVWRDGDVVVCEIRDRGQIRDPLAGRYKPKLGESGGWGLWLAHRVCDLVQVRSQTDGTTVRLHMSTS